MVILIARQVGHVHGHIYKILSDKDYNVNEYKCLLYTGNFYNFIFYFRYDHLSTILSKVLDQRPENAVDIFEDLSKDAKRSMFKSDADTVQDKIDQSTEVALAHVQKKLFAVSVHR